MSYWRCYFLSGYSRILQTQIDLSVWWIKYILRWQRRLVCHIVLRIRNVFTELDAYKIIIVHWEKVLALVAIPKSMYAVKEFFAAAEIRTDDLGRKLNFQIVHLLNYIQYRGLVLAIRRYWKVLYMRMHIQIYNYVACVQRYYITVCTYCTVRSQLFTIVIKLFGSHHNSYKRLGSI